MSEHAPVPWMKDPYADAIYADGPKGSYRVADIRGWGYLTGKGHGALGLPPEEATAIQHANADFIVQAVNEHENLVARLAEVTAERDRLLHHLAERIEENLWNAYNIGFERDGQWMDGARSEGEWLQAELGLEDGREHDASMIRDRIPGLARELAIRALSKEPSSCES